MSSWAQRFIRFGYATKGVLYGAIGWLAAQTALGARARTPDSERALRELGTNGIVGKELLLVVAVGLAIYACWRIVQAVLDVERHGKTLGGVAHRLSYVISGVSYALLALYAIRIATGLRAAGPDKKAITSKLMATPWGPWVVGLIGALLIAHGAFELQKAMRGSFMQQYRTEEMRSTTRRLVFLSGAIGIAARSLTFFIIGWFTIDAAQQASASRLKGLGEAFRVLYAQTHGPVLLATVALGFVLYGVYCMANARYRRLRV